MEKSKYEVWAEQKFEGLTGDELHEAAGIFGISVPKTTKHSIIRRKLCEASGLAVPNERPDPEQRAAPRARIGRPGLAPTEKWEGRRHTVLVHHSEENKGHEAFCLTWNGDCRAFPFDKKFDMPEPWYNILVGCNIKTVQQRKVKDSEGQLIAMESYDVSRPRFSFNDYGITPGTEELCGSVLEYWQKKAEANDFFKGLLSKQTGRQLIKKILVDVSEARGPDYYRDKTTDELHMELLQYLGFDDVMFDNIEEALA